MTLMLHSYDKLANAGIIEEQRKGNEICYSAIDERAKKILDLLTKGGNNIET